MTNNLLYYAVYRTVLFNMQTAIPSTGTPFCDRLAPWGKISYLAPRLTKIESENHHNPDKQMFHH